MCEFCTDSGTCAVCGYEHADTPLRCLAEPEHLFSVVPSGPDAECLFCGKTRAEVAGAGL